MEIAKLTLTINEKEITLAATGIRSTTLINHWNDGVLDTNDIKQGIAKGYLVENDYIAKPIQAVEKKEGGLLLRGRNCWYITTPLTLTTNRSVRFMYTFTKGTSTSGKVVGWNKYRVTEAGLNKLSKKYTFVGSWL